MTGVMEKKIKSQVKIFSNGGGLQVRVWKRLTFETGQSGLVGKRMYKQGLRRVWEIDSVDNQGKCISGEENSQCKDPNTESILECSWHSNEARSSETQ